MTALISCYWTEHEDLDIPGWERRAPHSAEVSGIVPMVTILMSVGDTPSAFVLRWAGTNEECKAAMDTTHRLGWEPWLALWEERKLLAAFPGNEARISLLDAQLLGRPT